MTFARYVNMRGCKAEAPKEGEKFVGAERQDRWYSQ